MLCTFVLAFSLAALALAAPNEGVTTIGSTLASALESAPLLVKRDEQADAVNGLAKLMSQAITAVSTGGRCSNECQPWVTDMQSCTGAGSDEQIGRCACGAMPLGDMGRCGSCFAEDDSVSKFKALCSAAVEGTGVQVEASVAGSALALAGVVGAVWLI